MKYKALALSLLLFSGVLLYSQNFEDYYSSWSSMFGIDPNSGTNSFLILLVPSGGKHEGMATAYTAIAIDSGFIDSNPAASSLLDVTELSFLHNNWINDVNIESVIFTTRLGNLGLGFAGKMMYLPFTGVNDWGDRYSNDYSGDYAAGYYWETVGTANVSYNILKNFYFDGISFGGSFKAAYRNVPFSIAQNQSAVAIMGDAGIMTRFNFLKPYYSRDKNFSLGLSVKNVGAEFIENPDPLPTRFSAGLAYSPFRPLTMAFDFNLPFNIDGTDAEAPYFAVGMDLTLTNFLSLQSGVLLKSGLPRFTIGTAVETAKVDFVINYTLDLTTQFSQPDRISLELRLNMGDYGRKERAEQAEILYVEGLKIYAEGRYQEAIKKWEACLELDPLFSPAKEMIDTAMSSFELQQEIQKRQSAE
ncbi:UPF0164 family protein [Spirochaeta isovalerica]|uniref:Tetratricopeptide repeat protein n=1 Tax=Spirochaeta isovalerica TaxID=150 RepID=A0A841R8W9_9SPIO|nr:UPF0164 family protein [Spirochaeta isovalerica]MBB6479168.1 hypothetical protein [Spirochaeta isovalerica]